MAEKLTTRNNKPIELSNISSEGYFGKDGKLNEPKSSDRESINKEGEKQAKKIWDDAIKEYEFSKMYNKISELQRQYKSGLKELEVFCKQNPENTSEYGTAFRELHIQSQVIKNLSELLEFWPRAEFTDEQIIEALKTGYIIGTDGVRVSVHDEKDIDIIVDVSPNNFFGKDGIYKRFDKKTPVLELAEKCVKYTTEKNKQNKKTKEQKAKDEANKSTAKSEEPKLMKSNKEGTTKGFYTAMFEFLAKKKKSELARIEDRYIKIHSDEDFRDKALKTMSDIYEKIEEIKKSIKKDNKAYPTSMALFLQNIIKYLNFQFDSVPNGETGIILASGLTREKELYKQKQILIGSGTDAYENTVLLLEKTMRDFVYDICTEIKPDGTSVFGDILRQADEYIATIQSQSENTGVQVSYSNRERFQRAMDIVGKTKELTEDERNSLYYYYESKLQNFGTKKKYTTDKELKKWLANRNAYKPVGEPDTTVESYTGDIPAPESGPSAGLHEHDQIERDRLHAKYTKKLEQYCNTPCEHDVRRMVDPLYRLIDAIPKTTSLNDSLGNIYIQTKMPDNRFFVESREVKKSEMMNPESVFLEELDIQFELIDQWFGIMNILREKKIIRSESILNILESNIPFCQLSEILPDDTGVMQPTDGYVFPNIQSVREFMNISINNPTKGIIYELTKGRYPATARKYMSEFSETNFVKKRISIEAALTNSYANSRPGYWSECLQYAIHLDYSNTKGRLIDRITNSTGSLMSNAFGQQVVNANKVGNSRIGILDSRVSTIPPAGTSAGITNQNIPRIPNPISVEPLIGDNVDIHPTTNGGIQRLDSSVSTLPGVSHEVKRPPSRLRSFLNFFGL